MQEPWKNEKRRELNLDPRSIMIPPHLMSLSIIPIAGIILAIVIFVIAGFNEGLCSCKGENNPSKKRAALNKNQTRNDSFLDSLDLESQIVKNQLGRPCLCMMPFSSALFVIMPALQAWTTFEIQHQIINNQEGILNDRWEVNWPVTYLSWCIVGVDLLCFIAICVTHASGLKNRRANKKAREKNKKIAAKMRKLELKKQQSMAISGGKAKDDSSKPGDKVKTTSFTDPFSDNESSSTSGSISIYNSAESVDLNHEKSEAEKEILSDEESNIPSILRDSKQRTQSAGEKNSRGKKHRFQKQNTAISENSNISTIAPLRYHYQHEMTTETTNFVPEISEQEIQDKKANLKSLNMQFNSTETNSSTKPLIGGVGGVNFVFLIQNSFW